MVDNENFLDYYMGVKTKRSLRKKRYKKHQFNFELSPNNRETYIYKTDERKNIVEITCVSLEIKIDSKWITILYYDDTHGSLHRHTVLSLKQKIDMVQNIEIQATKSKTQALKWAIEDIKWNYLRYKEKFVTDILGLTMGIDIDDY